MYMTRHNLEFGVPRLAFLARGCAANAYFDRFSVINCYQRIHKNANNDFKAPSLMCCKRDFGPSRVFQTKTPEAFEHGVVGADIQPKGLIDLPSLSNMYGLVAEDLLTLNKNLQSIVGAENPVLMSAAEQIFGAGGKRMRPALVFLVSRATAQITGLMELTKEHRQLAEVIELIHTASLIHDDVLDESNMRRGKESVHQLYGARVAVLAGDFMFAQSSWYMANLENLEVIKLISEVIKDFASGEIKQASSLFDCNIHLDEYLTKSHHKTASLIAASTKAAAIFSGVNGEIAEQMYQYGQNLGLSFQVVDDILDFTQSAEQLGKPVGSDLAKGNLTAPVIFALEKDPQLRDIIESKFYKTNSLEKAVEIVKNSGSIERAWELAKKKADEAAKNLRCLPSGSFRLALEQMVMYNLERIT